MRETITILACALIALLTAALSGPWLVDWTAHRDFVEAELSRAVGVKVATRGDIDLKLLPTPYLALDGFDLDGAGATVHAGKTRFEMQVMPLMRGELRFYDASIDAPDITLNLAADAKPPSATRADASFDRVHVTNATLHLVDAKGAQTFGVSGVDVDGEASSLLGPFKGAGSFRRGADAVPFRFATGGVDAGRMKLKLVSDEAADLPRADLDGTMLFDDPRHPAFEGAATISGVAPSPWKLTGPLRVDDASARIDKLDARIGADDAAITLQGAANVEFNATPTANITLNARQFDVDKLMMTPAFAALRSRVNDAAIAARLPMALDVSVTTPAALLGDDTLSDVSARLRLTPGASISVEFSAGAGPGGSKLSLKGEVETGAAAAYRGRLAASARDLPRFADWLAKALPDEAARLRALPARAFDVAGDVTFSGAGFSAKNLVIKADRSTMTGAAAFTRAIGGERARFYADLSSDAFDLDTAPDLSAPASALADADLAVSVDARAIRVARFGEGTIDAGRIRLRLNREAETLNLEDLSIADLGGASLRASGRSDASGGHLDGAITADRLGDLATFLKRIAPGAPTDALGARATALSPAKVGFHLDAARSGPDAALAVSALTLDGTARGTTVKAAAKPAGEAGGLAGTLTLESTDAALFARQLGFDVITAPNPGAARLDLTARGGVASGFDVNATTKVSGAALSFRGRVKNAADARGEIGVDAADVAPLLRLLGAGLPDATAKPPAKLTARAKWSNGRLALNGLAGSIAGGAVAGDLTLAPEPDLPKRMKWTGALRLDHLSLPALSEVALGPARATKPGEVWSSTPFAAGMARAPLVAVGLSVGTLTLSDNQSAADARLKLAVAPGVVTIDEVNALLGDGRVSGHLTLRRDGANASLTGEASIEGYTIDRPAASGVLSGALEASATGGSMAALMSGLAGQGKARVDGLTISRADPTAPSRVLARVDTGDLFVSENDFLGALRRELDAAPFKAGDTTFDATITGGVVKLSSAFGPTLAYDARAGSLETRALLTLKPLPKDWDGQAPRLAVIWKGSPIAPTRDLDAGMFIASLTARALAREQARIEAFEADVRERAFFNRRLKGLAFMHQREKEIAAFDAEQARIAAEVEKRRVVAEIEAEKRRVAEAVEAERRHALEAAKQERERRAADARKRLEDAAEQPASAPATRSPNLFVPPPPDVDPSAAGRY